MPRTRKRATGQNTTEKAPTAPTAFQSTWCSGAAAAAEVAASFELDRGVRPVVSPTRASPPTARPILLTQHERLPEGAARGAVFGAKVFFCPPEALETAAAGVSNALVEEQVRHNGFNFC